MLIRILGKDRMLLVVPPEGFLLGEELASWGGEGKGGREDGVEERGGVEVELGCPRLQCHQAASRNLSFPRCITTPTGSSVHPVLPVSPISPPGALKPSVRFSFHGPGRNPPPLTWTAAILFLNLQSSPYLPPIHSLSQSLPKCQSSMLSLCSHSGKIFCYS